MAPSARSAPLHSAHRTAAARIARSVVLLSVMLPSVAPLAAQSRGTLLVVGGGPQPPALVAEFVRLAGGRDARIVIFAMASASGRTSGEEKAADLRRLGATAMNVWLTRAQAGTDSAASLLDGATGVWFGGGDQGRLADVLRGTPVLAAIRSRFDAGAVVGGTSAGAAVLSTPMITGDERRPGGARPDTSEAWLTIEREDVITTDGFGFITNAIVDQHFLRRKRHNRLLSLVLEGPQRLGVGIDESTALRIGPDGIWHVLGASAAVVYDARSSAVTPGGVTLGVTGMRMHVLPAGSRFDPRDGAARLP